MEAGPAPRRQAAARGDQVLEVQVRERLERDPHRPVYVISVAASIVRAHPRTLRIYEDEGLLCPARTPTNIRLYSEEDIRRLLWIRHLTQNLGVNLAGIRILFELEERMGIRILEALFDEAADRASAKAEAAANQRPTDPDPTDEQPSAYQPLDRPADEHSTDRQPDANRAPITSRPTR